MREDCPVGLSLWQKCLERLEGELTSQQFNTWIRPLHAVEDEKSLNLLAPNRFVLERVNDRFMEQIVGIVAELKKGPSPEIRDRKSVV